MFIEELVPVNLIVPDRLPNSAIHSPDGLTVGREFAVENIVARDGNDGVFAIAFNCTINSSAITN